MSDHFRILVTGVGAIIGYGIVHCLKNCKYEVDVIGIDIYDDAVGQIWCDEFHQGILASSDEFVPFLSKLIVDDKIDLVIPGIEQDLWAISANLDRLPTRAKYVIGNRELLGTLSDKWESQTLFADAGIKTIPSRLVSINTDFLELTGDLGCPFVLKPRVSYASKGIGFIDSQLTFRRHIETFDQFEFIAQRKMKGEELTVSIFGHGHGDFSNPIVLSRTLAQDGSTHKATWREPHTILSYLSPYVIACKPVGPTNFQFIVEEGYPYLLEVNPRVSSSTSIRALCGVNEAEMCIEFYLHGIQPAERQQQSVRCVRFIQDAILL